MTTCELLVLPLLGIAYILGFELAGIVHRLEQEIELLKSQLKEAQEK